MVVATVMSIVLTAWVNTTHANAATSSSWDQHRVQVFRHDHDVESMQYSTVLGQRAHHWAHRLAYGHIKLADDQDPRACWKLGGDFIGSNTARGHYIGVHELEYLLEHSDKHRSNLLDHRFRWFGIGVVHHNHRTYLVQEFCGVTP